MADCRKHTLKPLRQVCRAVTMLGKPLDRFAGDRVALAGSKGQAVNAQARYCTPDKRTQRLAPIDQRLAGYRQDRDDQDSPDEAGPPGGAVADQGQAQREAREQRQLLYPEGQAQ